MILLTLLTVSLAMKLLNSNRQLDREVSSPAFLEVNRNGLFDNYYNTIGFSRGCLLSSLAELIC